MRMTIEELEEMAREKEKNYKIENGYYFCKDCGTEIEQIFVTFSIWDGLFKMSGSGKTERQVFPYCPKCEERPDISGEPIRIKQF